MEIYAKVFGIAQEVLSETMTNRIRIGKNPSATNLRCDGRIGAFWFFRDDYFNSVKAMAMVGKALGRD